MKNYILSFIIFCFPFALFSQQVKLLTTDELDKRIHKGLDTTYIINFWATWCSPCIKELPAFEKIANEFKTEKLSVLLISVNFRSELDTSVIPFVKKQKIMSEVFLFNERDQQQYIDRIDTSWSGSIPATLFIKNGKHLFFEKDFTYEELVKEYRSLN